jgi:hypothetical protein
MNRLHSLAALLLAASLTTPAFAQPAPAEPPQNFSQAEKLLLMSRQLDNVALPGKLRYAFRQSGSVEPAFEDKISISVDRTSAGRKCCKASGDFLSGERKITLPEIEDAEGNPVVLYFLENDIRTMQRLTKGSQNYFRKRIRMALFNDATVRPVRVAYQGKDIDAQEILISPYLDDPNRAKFEKYLGKQYRFILAPAVPGGVYGIQTVVASPQPGQAPLIQQEMLIEGAAAFAPKASS